LVWFGSGPEILNLELNLRFSSAYCPNLELNLGSVQAGSGSNLGSEPNLPITTTDRILSLQSSQRFAQTDEKGDQTQNPEDQSCG